MHIKRIVSRLLLPTLFICFLFSCDRKLDRQFDEIEATLSQNPQAAYEKLSELSLQELGTRRARARYALLMSLAQDKSYIDVTEDSLIRHSINFYESHGTKKEKMLSWYMLGRIQQNAGNRTAAIISLLNAKDLAEDIADYHYYGLITRSIAYLYGDCYDSDSELYYYQESTRAFERLNEPLYAAYSQYGEARVYIAKGKRREADSLLSRIESYSRKNDKYLLSLTLMDQAVNNMYSDTPDAKKTISIYREVDSLGVMPKRTSDYCMMALAYDRENNQDSVLYYIGCAESVSKTRTDSVHLYNIRAMILSAHGDFKSAIEQVSEGVAIHNQMTFKKENQQIANAISDYNRQKAEEQGVIADYRKRLLLLLSFTIVILLIVLFQTIILRKKQIRERNRVILEKERKIEEDIAQINEISDELQSSRTNRSDMAVTINNLLKEKISIVKLCADAYERVKNGPRVNPKDPYRYLDDDPINNKTLQVNQFLKALESFREDESLFSLLEDGVNKWRDNLMVKLRSACPVDSDGKPQLTEEDFRMLMLFYAGIPDRSVAFLMNLSYATVRTRKTRYKQRLIQPDVRNGKFFVDEMSPFEKPTLIV